MYFSAGNHPGQTKTGTKRDGLTGRVRSSAIRISSPQNNPSKGQAVALTLPLCRNSDDRPESTSCLSPSHPGRSGSLDAIHYVLLHEATHVVDAVLNLTPHPNDREAIVPPTAFIKGIWQKMNQPVSTFTNSLLNLARRRNGSVPLAAASVAIRRYNKRRLLPTIVLLPGLNISLSW